jgi:hypothetical protein
VRAATTETMTETSCTGSSVHRGWLFSYSRHGVIHQVDFVAWILDWTSRTFVPEVVFKVKYNDRRSGLVGDGKFDRGGGGEAGAG